MLAVFCLRLASGMIGALTLFSSSQVNPRFYRTHFLTALALTTAAAVLARATAGLELWIVLAAALLLSFLGSLLWSLEGAPAGRLVIVLTALAQLGALGMAAGSFSTGRSTGPGAAVELSSAALLGSAMTAMLMGHSYLLAPAMSLSPLLRLLAALFTTLFLRALISGVILWLGTETYAENTLTEQPYFLYARWVIGFVLPAVLGVLAWRAARMRSTQSATGILYVVVILVFLGELLEEVKPLY
jgi:hypothetical protein